MTIQKLFLLLQSIQRVFSSFKFRQTVSANIFFNSRVPNYRIESTPYTFSSMLCREQHFHMPLYTYWCNELCEIPFFHRKQWEFIFICHVLYERNYLKSGLSAIGFGVGKEPLVSYFAKHGLKVLATDLDFESAKNLGWVDTNQHSNCLLALNERSICPEDIFMQNTKFKTVDMNHIPSDIGNYDICWSSCAFEHLGSIRKGLDFIINSSRLLNPGGIAVHTTEFNISSNDLTLDNHPSFVIFRKKDIEELSNTLESEGFIMETVDYSSGNDELEQYVDLPPYVQNKPHLRVELSKLYVSTSIGIIIRRPNIMS